MTTLHIDSDDKTAIQEIRDFVIKNFHFKVEIVKDTTSTKWADFANNMDGIFTSDIVDHIAKSRKEARDDFIANI